VTWTPNSTCPLCGNPSDSFSPRFHVCQTRGCANGPDPTVDERPAGLEGQRLHAVDKVAGPSFTFPAHVFQVPVPLPPPDWMSPCWPFSKDVGKYGIAFLHYDRRIGPGGHDVCDIRYMFGGLVTFTEVGRPYGDLFGGCNLAYNVSGGLVAPGTSFWVELIRAFWSYQIYQRIYGQDFPARMVQVEVVDRHVDVTVDHRSRDITIVRH
jgi:hypothetical protein